MLQVREKGSTGAWWAPERDITVIAPGLFRRAFISLAGKLTPDEADFSPGMLELQRQLGVTEAELSELATVYGKFVQLVQSRQPLFEYLPQLNDVSWRAQAVLGLVVLQDLTATFARHYYHTLHKGEPDPNMAALQAWLAVLNRPQPTRYETFICRLKLLWGALVYPLRWFGKASAAG